MLMNNLIKLPPSALTLARNLRSAMEARRDKYGSQSQLAKAAGVAQTSIGYMLNPETRQPTKTGKMPSPTIEAIDKVARALGMQPWQLLYPHPEDVERNARHRMLMDRIEADFAELRELEERTAKS